MTKQEMLDCIHEDMARNDVVPFMKGTPNVPKRGLSEGSARLFEQVCGPFIETSAGACQVK